MDLVERIFYTLPELTKRWGKSEDDLIHMAAAGALPMSIGYEGYISGLPAWSCQGFLTLYSHDVAKFLLGNKPVVQVSRFYDPDCAPDSSRKHFSPITLPENFENLEEAVQSAVPTKLKIARTDLVVMAHAVARLEAAQPELLARRGSAANKARDGVESPLAKKLTGEAKSAKAKAETAQPPAASQEFDSLTLALDGWFDKNLDDLPQELRQRAEREFSPIPWNGLSADQRHHHALQLDRKHDPATEQVHEYWWNFFARLQELKAQLQQWQSVATPTAGDMALQESRIKEFQQEIDRMELQERQGRVDYDPGSKSRYADGKPTSVTAPANTTLPAEVQSLIQRKLRHLRMEYDRKWPDITKAAYSKMDAGIVESMKSGRQGQATVAIPISAYREIVAGAVNMTRDWPQTVWEAIVSILDKAQVGPVEEKELHAIVAEHVWPIGQEPFTMRYIDADRFKESVSRELRRRGMTPAQSFERNLSLEAATGQCGISNTARHERERIGIAIAEYIIQAQAKKTHPVLPNSDAELEVVFPVSNSPDAPSVPVANACAAFLLMENLHPREISIAFVGDSSESVLSGNNMLEISARSVTRRMAVAEFGLVDRRSGSLSKQAAVLLGLAHEERFYRKEAKNSAIMTRLRAEFRNRLGVKADPFTPYHHETGWVPVFSIVDLRGRSDERAKHDAERRMVSFDQMQDQGFQFPADESSNTVDDAANTWLKKNNPKHLS